MEGRKGGEASPIGCRCPRETTLVTRTSDGAGPHSSLDREASGIHTLSLRRFLPTQGAS